MRRMVMVAFMLSIFMSALAQSGGKKDRFVIY